MLLRILTALGGVFLAWAAVLAITGGFNVRLGSVRISSQNPVAPLTLAVLCAIAVAAIAWVEGAAGPFAEERRKLRAAWDRVRALDRDRVARLASRASLGLLVAAVATFSFFRWAGDAPLWLDEQMIALNIRDRSTIELAGMLWFGQAAPFGWLVAERAMLVLFGPQGVNLRFLPVACGVGSVVAAAWVGRRWLTPVAALLLAALSGFAIWSAHVTFELKHYSADRLTALLLPALAAWALDAPDRPTFAKRAGVWWFAAAVAQWFSFGATLVTPGCAIVLVLFGWHRHGASAALGVARSSWVWASAFALHYAIALRFTHHSDFLNTYWASRLPAASLGIGGLATWIRDRLEPLAVNPGGTQHWIAWWTAGMGGLLFGWRRTLGLAFLPVPLSGFLFAAVGQVPLYERFSLWIVPALHVGIALAVDRALRWLLAWRRRLWPQLAAAVAVLAVSYALANDIITRGWRTVLSPHAREGEPAVDDRRAVSFVKDRLRPGDVILTTRLGWPAIWWYGVISARAGEHDPIQRGGIGDRGSGIGFLKISRDRTAARCDAEPLRAALAPYRRAIVFLGFPDEGEGFGELAVRRLSMLGPVISLNDFSALSRVAIIDLRAPQTIESSRALDEDLAARAARDTPKMLDGCVKVAPVERW
ncbi:MAG TPA: hypothetical protein VFO19_03630 [Vicinamibacterales bacterium]|nr:hypothetical protein [Vicinamibacterales bacterium]